MAETAEHHGLGQRIGHPAVVADRQAGEQASSVPGELGGPIGHGPAQLRGRAKRTAGTLDERALRHPDQSGVPG
ncbi:MAG: hypothetical protein ACTH9T_06545 [Mycetocola reblochoni]|uniref:hypothetical protein n=1 Tax=Mycetocola reblochoni TaxID=331618 RepID=UPI003F9C686F